MGILWAPLDVTVIVIKNGISDLSSNTRWDSLNFTLC